jgi:hypothetical protein
MEILHTFTNNVWQEKYSPTLQTQAVNALEDGKIVFFPKLAFALTADEQRFLAPHYVQPKTKNISFDKQSGQVRGAQATIEEQIALRALLARFHECARQLISALFPDYDAALIPARSSFRPVEISNRVISYRKDDKRLHVDAFPSNPNQGRRILRVFANINPAEKHRVWRAGEPFARVAQRFLPKISAPLPGSARCLHWLGITKSYRTAYDHYMLQMHDRMKGDDDYQRSAEQVEIAFPAGSAWIVFTDQVSHAAMSGQHMLEQTFYLPVAAMAEENKSPLRILEKLTKRTLV